MGQLRIFPETPFDAIARDQSEIDALLDEMHGHKSADWHAAKDRLRNESQRLVAEHWRAIDALAKVLWSKPWKPREQLPPIDAAWSSDKTEKSMDAMEVEAVVKEFGCTHESGPTGGELCPSARKSIMIDTLSPIPVWMMVTSKLHERRPNRPNSCLL